MNRKRRRRAFRVKIPATQRIDHTQLFGKQTLEEVLTDRQTALHHMLLHAPITEHERICTEWKASDEHIIKAYRGEIDVSTLQFVRKFYVNKE